MPPQIALIICTIFVLWLLRIDHKQAPKVSRALWIPTIWMLVIVSKPLGVWFGTGGVDMESGSSLDRAFLTILLCLGLIILVRRRFNWSSAIRKNIWLMLLIGYMLASILWSDLLYISLKRWTREVIAVVMAFLILSEPDPRQALQSIFRRTIYVLIPFSYILIHYFPEYGREYGRWSGEVMWTGVAQQKNSLGLLCLNAAFFLIWTFIRRRQGRVIPAVRYQTLLEAFILILTFWLMGGPQHNFSYSVTTNIALIVGLSALIGLFWMKKRGTVLGSKVLLALFAFIIFYGTVTPMIGGLSLMDVSSTFGRDETLTGRNEIWATLIPYAMKKPILGHGFGGFWTTEMRALTSAHAHNGYLDVVLNIGFFGLLLFAIFFLSFSRKAQRGMTQDFDWGALWICYLLMAVIHNIAESSIVGFTTGISAVLLFLAVSSTQDFLSTPRVSEKCDVS
jgi:O-antigen ligase